MLSAAAEDQEIEALGAGRIILQHIDQARPGRHHRHPLNARAERCAVLGGHDADDGMVGGLRRARETNDQVGLAQPPDEQGLFGARCVGLAVQDAPARAVAQEAVEQPGRRDDGEGDEQEDDELALVEARDRLEGAHDQRDGVEHECQDRAALQDVEEIRRRGEAPDRGVEAAISEQKMADENDAGPGDKALRGERPERKIRPRQNKAERHGDQDHDHVLDHDEGAPHLWPEPEHSFQGSIH